MVFFGGGGVHWTERPCLIGVVGLCARPPEISGRVWFWWAFCSAPSQESDGHIMVVLRFGGKFSFASIPKIFVGMEDQTGGFRRAGPGFLGDFGSGRGDQIGEPEGWQSRKFFGTGGAARRIPEGGTVGDFQFRWATMGSRERGQPRF